jgi:hypothetical protein
LIFDLDFSHPIKVDALKGTGNIGLSQQPWRLLPWTGWDFQPAKKYELASLASRFFGCREHGSRNSGAQNPRLPCVFRPGCLRNKK